MKTNREYRIANAAASLRQVIECRFEQQLVMALPVRIRINHKPQQTRQKMKIRHIVIGAVLTAAVTFTPNLFAGDCSNKKAVVTTCTSSKDIVAVASGGANFKTLVAAVKAAGLVETLQSEGPFTVFAPTDEAFAKLPAGTVEHLLKPENREQLASILKYHVIPGKVLAADVKTMEAKTAQGQSVKLQVSDGGVTVGGAKVVKTDLLAANGVIHVIDRVIMPES